MPNESESFPAAASPAIATAVRSGARALVVLQLGSQVVSLLGLAILMRLLVPQDYGLVLMVLPIVLFLRIFTTLGLPMATIQRRHLTPEATSALFWWNVLLGFGTAGLTCLIAPWVARWYDKPEFQEPITHITWALAATSIVAAWGTQHQALLERKLQFGRLGIARLTAQLIGAGAAIAAAVADWGPWALVVQQYVELVLLTGLVWCCEPWRPALPRWNAPLWNDGIAKILRWGGLFAASSVVLFAGFHADRLLVGRLVGPDAVGLYGQAFNLMIKPVYLLSTPLTALMIASLSRAVDQPLLRQELLVGYYRFVSLVLMPASIGLALVSADVMILMGGPGWAAAGPLLKALSLGMLGHAIIIVAGPVLTAAGRTGYLFAASVVLASVLLQGELCGWWIGNRYGQPTLGIAWGASSTIVVALAIPYTITCLRAAGYRVLPVLAAIVRPAQATLVMALFVWMCGQWLSGSPRAVRVAVEIAIGLLVYGVVARSEIGWLMRHWRPGQRVSLPDKTSI